MIIYFFSVHIHSVKYDDGNHISAHITGGPLFEKKIYISHIRIHCRMRRSK